MANSQLYTAPPAAESQIAYCTIIIIHNYSTSCIAQNTTIIKICKVTVKIVKNRLNKLTNASSVHGHGTITIYT